MYMQTSEPAHLLQGRFSHMPLLYKLSFLCKAVFVHCLKIIACSSVRLDKPLELSNPAQKQQP